MPMPSSSESSRIVASARIFADLLLVENVTTGPVAGGVVFAVVPGWAGAGLTAPNASVFSLSGATPMSASSALVASIIAGGPQT